MTVTDLPALNASLNASATFFIVAGLIFVKTGRMKAHIVSMCIALAFSAVFLGCYLYYHYQVGHVKFAGQGAVKLIYLALLFSHIILAVINLPMIILTVVPALRRRWGKHRRIAKWTAPVWLYVSVTGVIVYLMCYQWFGPPLR